MTSAFPYIELSGDAHEIGIQHGQKAYDLVHLHLNTALGKLERKDISHQQARERAKNYIPYIEKYTPLFAVELAGLAEGANIALEDAYLLQLRAEITDSPGLETSSIEAAVARDVFANECTSFAVSGELTESGKPISGQNADLPLSTRDVGIVVRISPDDRPDLLMLTPAGQISYIGISQQGMSAFANFLNTSGWRAGFPRYLLSRTALEQPTIDQAVDRLSGIPRASSRNLLLMDASGESVDLEMSVTCESHLHPVDGVLTHSNHFVATEMHQEEQAQPDRMANSCQRLERINELIASNRGTMTPETAMEIFRDREHAPDAICRHLGDGPGDYITFASVIASPATGELWVAPGPPDQHEYTHYDFS